MGPEHKSIRGLSEGMELSEAWEDTGALRYFPERGDAAAT